MCVVIRVGSSTYYYDRALNFWYELKKPIFRFLLKLNLFRYCTKIFTHRPVGNVNSGEKKNGL